MANPNLSAAEVAAVQLKVVDGPKFQAQMKAAAATVEQMRKSVKSAGKETDWAKIKQWGWNQALFTMRRLIYAGTLATIAFGSAIAYLGVKYDMMKQTALISFRVLLGSTRAAQKEYEYLYNLAAKTPWEFQGIQQAARQFLGWGFSIKQVNGYLLTLSNVIAAMGGDTSIMDRVILALGQIRSTGYLMGQDLRQLQQAIPGVSLMLKRMLPQITQKQWAAGVGALRIPSNIAINAIMQGIATDPKFKGAAAALQKSMQGQISTLHDYFSQLMGSIVKAPFNMVNKALPKINDNLLKLNKTMEKQGFTAMIDQLDGMINAGGRLSSVWDTISRVGSSIGKLFRNVIWPAFKDVSNLVGSVLKPIFDALAGTMAFLSHHSTILKLIIEALLIRFALMKFRSIALFVAWKGLLFLANPFFQLGRALKFFGLGFISWKNIKFLAMIKSFKDLKLAIYAVEKYVNGQAVYKMQGSMGKFLRWIEAAFIPMVGRGWAKFKGFMATMVSSAALALPRLWDFLQITGTRLKGLASALGGVAIAVGTKLVAAIRALTVAWKLWVIQLKASALWLLRNPIVLIVAAIILIGVVLGYVLYKYWRPFWNAIKSGWDAIRNAFTASGQWIESTFYTIWNNVVAGFKWFVNFMIQGLNFVIDRINGLTSGLSDVYSWTGIPRIPAIPHIPYLAEGGTITRSGYGVVGERGPELVSMPQGAQVIPLKHAAFDRLAGSLSGTLDVPIVLELDSKEIAAAVATVRLNYQARK